MQLFFLEDVFKNNTAAFILANKKYQTTLDNAKDIKNCSSTKIMLKPLLYFYFRES